MTRHAAPLSLPFALVLQLRLQKQDYLVKQSTLADGGYVPQQTPKQTLDRATSSPTPYNPYEPSTPFRIRLVRTSEQLRQAVSVRRVAYSERFAALAGDVEVPEICDREHEPSILIAENVDSGRVVGTVRLNLGPNVLDLLDDVDLPESFRSERVCYVSRMAAIGTGKEKRVIRELLSKAMFQFCLARQIQRLLLAPVVPRERLYYSWGFENVFSDGQPRTPKLLHHQQTILLQQEMFSVERRWKEENHSKYDFLFRTFHPEIQIFSSLSSVPSRRRPDALSVERKMLGSSTATLNH